jgi:hypothetical protein
MENSTKPANADRPEPIDYDTPENDAAVITFLRDAARRQNGRR